MKNGYALINKPAGITSHDVVYRVRNATGIKKVGHAGTLDPLATGLLIMLIGREATREQARFMKLDKEYVVTMELGKRSDTYDTEGAIEIIASEINIGRKDFDTVVPQFVGEIDQIPPAHSALKVGGKKAYELARAGEDVQLESRKIQIFEIEILEYSIPFVILKIHCGSGTYIRSLVHDIGNILKTGAIMTALKRTKIGSFTLEDAADIEEFSANPLEHILDIRAF